MTNLIRGNKKMKGKRRYHFRHLHLDDGVPNDPTGFYADEVMLNDDGQFKIVRREIYEIETFCLIDRLLQLRKIDRMLGQNGFLNYGYSFSFGLWCEDLDSRFSGRGLYHGSLGEQLCNKTYINTDGRGTEVNIRERSILDELKKSLEIGVHAKGSFEDYVYTCNLFRKYFGLKERIEANIPIDVYKRH